MTAIPEWGNINDRDMEFLVYGAWLLMLELIGDGGHKSYDPLTVDREQGVYHSYVFDMRDGGRHHAISDYASHEDAVLTILAEAANRVKTRMADAPQEKKRLF